MSPAPSLTPSNKAVVPIKLAHVAKQYGVSETTLRRWIRAKTIPYRLVSAHNVMAIAHGAKS